MSLANVQLKTQQHPKQKIIEMAGFRRLVDNNFATSEESVSQNREFYQDSQDLSLNYL